MASPPAAVPTTIPLVTYASDLLEATGVSAFMMTDEQETNAGEELIDSVQSLLTNATDLLGLNGTGIYPAGFAGAVDNPATGTLNLWWVSGVPQVLVDLINTLLPTLGITVHSADFSRADLKTAIEQHRFAMTGVDQAFPKEDGSGIVVTHAPGTTVDGEAIAALVGVPVTVAEVEPFEEAIGGRQADVASSSGGHYGGAMMVRSTHICSTGFSVLYGTTGLLLSAAHCDTTGNAAWNNGAGASLTTGGTAVSVNLPIDSMILDPVGGTDGYIYTGGYSSATKRAVSGTGANVVGESVASSGANSGEHRSKVVTDASYSDQCNTYDCTTVIAGASSGMAIAQGDSGGPVYHINSNGKVTAKGIIHGGSTRIAQATCNPLMKYDGTTAEPNKCYRYVSYIPIRTALAGWQNIRIETQ